MERILNPTKIYDIDLIDNKYIITNSNTNVNELIDICFELYPNESYKFNLNKNINNLIKLGSNSNDLFINNINGISKYTPTNLPNKEISFNVVPNNIQNITIYVGKGNYYPYDNKDYFRFFDSCYNLITLNKDIDYLNNGNYFFEHFTYKFYPNITYHFEKYKKLDSADASNILFDNSFTFIIKDLSLNESSDFFDISFNDDDELVTGISYEISSNLIRETINLDLSNLFYKNYNNETLLELKFPKSELKDLYFYSSNLNLLDRNNVDISSVFTFDISYNTDFRDFNDISNLYLTYISTSDISVNSDLSYTYFFNYQLEEKIDNSRFDNINLSTITTDTDISYRINNDSSYVLLDICENYPLRLSEESKKYAHIYEDYIYTDISYILDNTNNYNKYYYNSIYLYINKDFSLNLTSTISFESYNTNYKTNIFYFHERSKELQDFYINNTNNIETNVETNIFDLNEIIVEYKFKSGEESIKLKYDEELDFIYNYIDISDIYSNKYANSNRSIYINRTNNSLVKDISYNKIEYQLTNPLTYKNYLTNDISNIIQTIIINYGPFIEYEFKDNSVQNDDIIFDITNDITNIELDISVNYFNVNTNQIEYLLFDVSCNLYYYYKDVKTKTDISNINDYLLKYNSFYDTISNNYYYFKYIDFENNYIIINNIDIEEHDILNLKKIDSNTVTLSNYVNLIKNENQLRIRKYNFDRNIILHNKNKFETQYNLFGLEKKLIITILDNSINIIFTNNNNEIIEFDFGFLTIKNMIITSDINNYDKINSNYVYRKNTSDVSSNIKIIPKFNYSNTDDDLFKLNNYGYINNDVSLTIDISINYVTPTIRYSEKSPNYILDNSYIVYDNTNNELRNKIINFTFDKNNFLYNNTNIQSDIEINNILKDLSSSIPLIEISGISMYKINTDATFTTNEFSPNDISDISLSDIFGNELKYSLSNRDLSMYFVQDLNNIIIELSGNTQNTYIIDKYNKYSELGIKIDNNTTDISNIDMCFNIFEIDETHINSEFSYNLYGNNEISYNLTYNKNFIHTKNSVDSTIDIPINISISLRNTDLSFVYKHKDVNKNPLIGNNIIYYEINYNNIDITLKRYINIENNSIPEISLNSLILSNSNVYNLSNKNLTLNIDTSYSDISSILHNYEISDNFYNNFDIGKEIDISLTNLISLNPHETDLSVLYNNRYENVTNPLNIIYEMSYNTIINKDNVSVNFHNNIPFTFDICNNILDQQIYLDDISNNKEFYNDISIIEITENTKDISFEIIDITNQIGLQQLKFIINDYKSNHIINKVESKIFTDISIVLNIDNVISNSYDISYNNDNVKTKINDAKVMKLVNDLSESYMNYVQRSNTYSIDISYHSYIYENDGSKDFYLSKNRKINIKNTIIPKFDFSSDIIDISFGNYENDILNNNNIIINKRHPRILNSNVINNIYEISRNILSARDISDNPDIFDILINENREVNFRIPENTYNNYMYNYIKLFEIIYDYSINGIIDELEYDEISNNIIYDLSLQTYGFYYYMYLSGDNNIETISGNIVGVQVNIVNDGPIFKINDKGIPFVHNIEKSKNNKIITDASLIEDVYTFSEYDKFYLNYYEPYLKSTISDLSNYNFTPITIIDDGGLNNNNRDIGQYKIIYESIDKSKPSKNSNNVTRFERILDICDNESPNINNKALESYNKIDLDIYSSSNEIKTKLDEKIYTNIDDYGDDIKYILEYNNELINVDNTSNYINNENIKNNYNIKYYENSIEISANKIELLINTQQETSTKYKAVIKAKDRSNNIKQETITINIMYKYDYDFYILIKRQYKKDNNENDISMIKIDHNLNNKLKNNKILQENDISLSYDYNKETFELETCDYDLFNNIIDFSGEIFNNNEKISSNFIKFDNYTDTDNIKTKNNINYINPSNKYNIILSLYNINDDEYKRKRYKLNVKDTVCGEIKLENVIDTSLITLISENLDLFYDTKEKKDMYTNAKNIDITINDDLENSKNYTKFNKLDMINDNSFCTLDLSNVLLKKYYDIVYELDFSKEIMVYNVQKNNEFLYKPNTNSYMYTYVPTKNWEKQVDIKDISDIFDISINNYKYNVTLNNEMEKLNNFVQNTYNAAYRWKKVLNNKFITGLKPININIDISSAIENIDISINNITYQNKNSKKYPKTVDISFDIVDNKIVHEKTLLHTLGRALGINRRSMFESNNNNNFEILNNSNYYKGSDKFLNIYKEYIQDASYNIDNSFIRLPIDFSNNNKEFYINDDQLINDNHLFKGIKSLGLSNEILCTIKDQNTSTRKLSKISIGLLEELGYDVCYNEADNYEITEKVNIIKTLNIEINKNDEHTIDIYKIYIANTDNTKFNNYKLSEISNKYAIGDSKNNPYIIGYISGDLHTSYSNRTELLYLDRGITIKNIIDGSFNYYNSSLFTSNYEISYNYILNIRDNSYVINNESYNNDSNNKYEISHNYYDNEISLNIIDLSNILNFNESSIDNSSVVQIFYVKDEFNNEISMNKYIKLTILPPYITLSGSPDASNIELYLTEYEPFVDYGHSIFDVIDGSLAKIQDVSLVIKNKNLNDNIKYNIKESELNGIDYRFITNNIGNYDILYKKSNSNNKEAKKHRDLKIVKTQPLEYITYLKLHDNNLFFDKNNDISNNLNKLDLSNILCYKYTINNVPYEYDYSDKYVHNNIYDISYIINLEKNYYYAFILPFDISNNININYSNNVELVTRQIYNIYDKKDTSCNLYKLQDICNNGYITMKKINNFDRMSIQLYDVCNNTLIYINNSKDIILDNSYNKLYCIDDISTNNNKIKNINYFDYTNDINGKININVKITNRNRNIVGSNPFYEFTNNNDNKIYNKNLYLSYGLYEFDTHDSSNFYNKIEFFYDLSYQKPYTKNIRYTNLPGMSNSKFELLIEPYTPNILYYKSHRIKDISGKLQINSNICFFNDILSNNKYLSLNGNITSEKMFKKTDFFTIRAIENDLCLNTINANSPVNNIKIHKNRILLSCHTKETPDIKPFIGITQGNILNNILYLNNEKKVVFINDISKGDLFNQRKMKKLKKDTNENNYEYYDSCYNYLFNIPEDNRLDTDYLTNNKTFELIFEYYDGSYNNNDIITKKIFDNTNTNLYFNIIELITDNIINNVNYFDNYVNTLTLNKIPNKYTNDNFKYTIEDMRGNVIINDKNYDVNILENKILSTNKLLLNNLLRFDSSANNIDFLLYSYIDILNYLDNYKKFNDVELHDIQKKIYEFNRTTSVLDKSIMDNNNIEKLNDNFDKLINPSNINKFYEYLLYKKFDVHIYCDVSLIEYIPPQEDISNCIIFQNASMFLRGNVLNKEEVNNNDSQKIFEDVDTSNIVFLSSNKVDDVSDSAILLTQKNFYHNIGILPDSNKFIFHKYDTNDNKHTNYLIYDEIEKHEDSKIIVNNNNYLIDLSSSFYFDFSENSDVVESYVYDSSKNNIIYSISNNDLNKETLSIDFDVIDSLSTNDLNNEPYKIFDILNINGSTSEIIYETINNEIYKYDETYTFILDLNNYFERNIYKIPLYKSENIKPKNLKYTLKLSSINYVNNFDMFDFSEKKQIIFTNDHMKILDDLRSILIVFNYYVQYIYITINSMFYEQTTYRDDWGSDTILFNKIDNTINKQYFNIHERLNEILSELRYVIQSVNLNEFYDNIRNRKTIFNDILFGIKNDDLISRLIPDFENFQFDNLNNVIDDEIYIKMDELKADYNLIETNYDKFFNFFHEYISQDSNIANDFILERREDYENLKEMHSSFNNYVDEIRGIFRPRLRDINSDIADDIFINSLMYKLVYPMYEISYNNTNPPTKYYSIYNELKYNYEDTSLNEEPGFDTRLLYNFDICGDLVTYISNKITIDLSNLYDIDGENYDFSYIDLNMNPIKYTFEERQIDNPNNQNIRKWSARSETDPSAIYVYKNDLSFAKLIDASINQLKLIEISTDASGLKFPKKNVNFTYNDIIINNNYEKVINGESFKIDFSYLLYDTTITTPREEKDEDLYYFYNKTDNGVDKLYIDLSDSLYYYALKPYDAVSNNYPQFLRIMNDLSFDYLESLDNYFNYNTFEKLFDDLKTNFKLLAQEMSIYEEIVQELYDVNYAKEIFEMYDICYNNSKNINNLKNENEQKYNNNDYLEWYTDFSDLDISYVKSQFANEKILTYKNIKMEDVSLSTILRTSFVEPIAERMNDNGTRLLSTAEEFANIINIETDSLININTISRLYTLTYKIFKKKFDLTKVKLFGAHVGIEKIPEINHLISDITLKGSKLLLRSIESNSIMINIDVNYEDYYNKNLYIDKYLLDLTIPDITPPRINFNDNFEIIIYHYNKFTSTDLKDKRLKLNLLNFVKNIKDIEDGSSKYSVYDNKTYMYIHKENVYTINDAANIEQFYSESVLSSYILDISLDSFFNFSNFNNYDNTIDLLYGYVDILFIVKDKLNNTRKYNKNIKIYEAINGPRIYYNNNFVPNLFNIPLNITSPDIRYEILSDIVNFKSLNYDFNANLYKFYDLTSNNVSVLTDEYRGIYEPIDNILIDANLNMEYIINYMDTKYPDSTYDNYLSKIINNIENREIRRYEKFIKYSVLDSNLNEIILYRDIIVNIITEEDESKVKPCPSDCKGLYDRTLHNYKLGSSSSTNRQQTSLIKHYQKKNQNI